jgi:tRNA 2-thiocytidine biosynthesis protein TtcA
MDKLEQKIKRLVGSNITKYNLINNNDKILVAISGGKDSYLLLYILDYFKKVAPIKFEVVPIHINLGYSLSNQQLLIEYTSKMGYECIIIKENLTEIINQNIKTGKNPCSICSRMRRGVLYTQAKKYSCNKIALGHNRNDLIETFLMNTFLNGAIATMPITYETKNRDLFVIRPIASIPEELIIEYSNKYKNYIFNTEELCPYIKKADNLVRSRVKHLIRSLREDFPNIEDSIFSSLSNIHTKEMLDKSLLDD